MLPSLLFTILLPPCWAVVGYRTGWLGPWEVAWAVFGAECAVVDAVLGSWWPALAGVVQAVIGVVLWWWNRRGRDRAKAWASEKYRHVRDALARRQREHAQPRPVLAPEGAR